MAHAQAPTTAAAPAGTSLPLVLHAHAGQEQSCSKKGYTPCTAPSDKANGVKCCWLEGAGLGTPRCIALSPGVTLRSPGLCGERRHTWAFSCVR